MLGQEENAHSRVAEQNLLIKQICIKFRTPEIVVQQLYSGCGEKKK